MNKKLRKLLTCSIALILIIATTMPVHEASYSREEYLKQLVAQFDNMTNDELDAQFDNMTTDELNEIIDYIAASSMTRSTDGSNLAAAWLVVAIIAAAMIAFVIFRNIQKK